MPTPSESPDGRPPLVLVAGMHRSGTSAITSLILGGRGWAGAPEELLPPARGNEHGFFERADLVALHDSWLARLGGAWDDPPSHHALDEFRPRAAQEAAAYLARLAQRTPECLTPVLKDPRMALFLDVWVEEAPDAAVVIPVRHPYEVAESLWRRDAVRHRKTYALWEKYVLETLSALRHRSSLLVNFTELTTDADRARWVTALRVAVWGEAADLGDPQSLRPHLIRAALPAQDRHAIDHRWLPPSTAGLWQQLSTFDVVTTLDPAAPLSASDLAARLHAIDVRAVDGDSA